MTSQHGRQPATVTQSTSPNRHPRGTEARVLLTSVFGPYAQDDEFGSRKINPMELYHNQVTKLQGPFSLRMFHRSWGLMLMQANMSAPCTVLDFPTRERFIEELQTRTYDVIGITSIIPNIGKVAAMCALIREHQPEATIVVGGHCANVPDLAERLSADHIVRGEGVRWFRTYFGEDPDQPLRHPVIQSGFDRRCLGVDVPHNDRDVTATVIPSVGCPMGCNFCSTSAMFGGKGRFINFYETGDELFDIMCGLETTLKAQSFFMMDENFLLHRKRALQLLERMKEHDKAWSLYVFSSANALRSYTMDQLVGLGVSWVWMGIEGENSQYSKLKETDSQKLVKDLQVNGIRVLGSTIIGLEEHNADNIDAVIDFAVSHETEFHQFMLYTPLPGTGLHAELAAQDLLLDREAFPFADLHGQHRFAHRHPQITGGQETEFLERAFRRDFEVNGPSVLRVLQSTLAGWRTHKHHPEARVRRRFERELQDLSVTFAGALWAARRWFSGNDRVVAKMTALLRDLYRECGLKARLAAPLYGRAILHFLRREAKRQAGGAPYEPPTFYETNVADARSSAGPQPTLARWVDAARPDPSTTVPRSAPLAGAGRP